MALNSNRVSAIASPGMAAAATARPVSGGRNVASVSRGPLEEAGFSHNIGINDNRLWRYDEETQFDAEGGEQQPQQQGTPFIIRSANGFRAEAIEDASEAGSTGRVFLNEVMRGVGVYEFNMRITTPGAVRSGSVLNYRT